MCVGSFESKVNVVLSLALLWLPAHIIGIKHVQADRPVVTHLGKYLCRRSALTFSVCELSRVDDTSGQWS